ncbi:hypothetical protein PENSPDRAFT_321284 [Peniophora sp. CONT]|nr:hypothetical protein PENSPDRAFT_321284 [Peniophora sp. CONT]
MQHSRHTGPLTPRMQQFLLDSDSDSDVDAPHPPHPTSEAGPQDVGGDSEYDEVPELMAVSEIMMLAMNLQVSEAAEEGAAVVGTGEGSAEHEGGENEDMDDEGEESEEEEEENEDDDDGSDEYVDEEVESGEDEEGCSAGEEENESEGNEGTESIEEGDVSCEIEFEGQELVLEDVGQEDIGEAAGAEAEESEGAEAEDSASNKEVEGVGNEREGIGGGEEDDVKVSAEYFNAPSEMMSARGRLALLESLLPNVAQTTPETVLQIGDHDWESMISPELKLLLSMLPIATRETAPLQADNHEPEDILPPELQSLLSQLSVATPEAVLHAGGQVFKHVITGVFGQPDTPLWPRLLQKMMSSLTISLDDTMASTAVITERCDERIYLLLSGEGLQSLQAILALFPGAQLIHDMDDSRRKLLAIIGGVYVHIVSIPKRLVDLLKSTLRSLDVRVPLLIHLLTVTPIVDGFLTLVYWGVWTKGTGNYTCWSRFDHKIRRGLKGTPIEVLIYAILSNLDLEAGCPIFVSSLFPFSDTKKSVVDLEVALTVIESFLMLLTPQEVGLVNVLQGEANIATKSGRSSLKAIFRQQDGYLRTRAKVILDFYGERLKEIARELPTTTIELLKVDLFLRSTGRNSMLCVPFHVFGHPGQDVLEDQVSLSCLLPTFEPASGKLKSPDHWVYYYYNFRVPWGIRMHHAFIRPLLCWKEPYPEGVSHTLRAWFELYYVKIVDGSAVVQPVVARWRLFASTILTMLENGFFRIGVLMQLYSQSDLDEFTEAFHKALLRCPAAGCDWVFLSRNPLSKHLHRHPEMFKCKFCNIALPTLQIRMDHERDNVCVDENGDPTDALVCGHQESSGNSAACSVRCHDRAALHDHRREEHEVEGYPCGECDAIFWRERDLDDHQRAVVCVVNGIKFPPPKCLYCPWRFDVKIDKDRFNPYTYHILRDHGSQASVCPSCRTEIYGDLAKALAHAEACDGVPPDDRCDVCHRYSDAPRGKAKHKCPGSIQYHECEKCGRVLTVNERFRVRHTERGECTGTPDVVSSDSDSN